MENVPFIDHFPTFSQGKFWVFHVVLYGPSGTSLVTMASPCVTVPWIFPHRIFSLNPSIKYDQLLVNFPLKHRFHSAFSHEKIHGTLRLLRAPGANDWQQALGAAVSIHPFPGTSGNFQVLRCSAESSNTLI